ncbi:MAG: tryptophan--tRNA ligase, partial [Candidatus Acidiferrales bacterium]
MTHETKRKRVLSGMRPTGRLHIGHYFGALSNWLKMQESYDCFYFVADWHALTTHYADSSQVATNTLEVATDWLAVGLDPAKATLFIQSSVPEHAELHLLLSMITPLSWLERVPTYKEQIENLREKDLGTYGFLGYPLLQSADIVMYGLPAVAGEPGRELLVPVGEDQAPHIEMTREIVRRFNVHYGFEVKDELFKPENKGALNRILASSGVIYPVHGDPRPGEIVMSEHRHLFAQRAAHVGIDNFFRLVGEDRKFFDFEGVL